MQFKTIIGKAATALSLSLVCALPAHAAGITGQGTWEYTLLGRDINRHAVAATDSSAIYLYDTKLGVTWLRDAYANPTANGNGTMTWSEATSWAANLSTSMGALSNWRLPTMTDTGTLGCNFSYGGTDCGYHPDTASSEMASLFFDTLGNKALYTASNVKQTDGGWPIQGVLGISSPISSGSTKSTHRFHLLIRGPSVPSMATKLLTKKTS
jgi:hypothetical protein